MRYLLPCDDRCLGWNIREDGTIVACDCRRFLSDKFAALSLRLWLNQFPVENTHKHSCSAACRGWDVFEREGSIAGSGHEIDHCTDCFPHGGIDSLEEALTFIRKHRSKPS